MVTIQVQEGITPPHPIITDLYSSIETIYDGKCISIKIKGVAKKDNPESVVCFDNTEDLIEQFAGGYSKDKVLCHVSLVSKVKGEKITKYLIIGETIVCVILAEKDTIIKKYIWINARKAIEEIIDDLNVLSSILIERIDVYE